MTQAVYAGAYEGQLGVSGWANLNRKGDYNTVHNHPNALWSGVYYVDPGDNSGVGPLSGAIDFLDPRGGADMVTIRGNPAGMVNRHHPEPGLLLIFPGWLQHFVHPFQGEGERITIAFNVIPV
jgi:uncharacterized protein (TIGR02466 family)